MKFLTILLILLSLAACQSQTGEEKNNTAKIAAPVPAGGDIKAPQETPTETQETATEEQQTPPAPPLFENFQATPKLSLFPRAGAFRPEDDDDKGLPYWRTYIDHLIRTSGPMKTDDNAEGNLAFGFRAVKGLDSVGLFSPLAVKPDTTYEVRTNFSCDLIKGASAGIGILEFDEFMWIGDQYPESLSKEHQVGSQTGISLTGLVKKQEQKFTFTTGPKTKMIHLLFFRDGEHDRNPVIIDDIGIKEAGSGL